MQSDLNKSLSFLLCLILVILSTVWLTPLGKTDISFLSTLSEDFAEFFPRIENLVCLQIRAPTFLDRVMFGRLTGKWIGKMLSAQQCRNSTDPRNQQFGFAGKIFPRRNLSLILGISLVSQDYQRVLVLHNLYRFVDNSITLISHKNSLS